MKKLLVVLLALLMLVGCSGGGSDTPTTGESSEEGAVSVVIQTDTDLSSMDNDIATDGTSFEAQTLCYAGLMQLDANNNPFEDLAEKYEVSEDGLTWTFTLRDGIKWSNGDPITANDFVYGYRRIVNPALASDYGFLFGAMNVTNGDACYAGEKDPSELGVEAVDEKTLVFHLDIPCDFLLNLCAFPSLFPVNQKFCEEKGDQFATSPENILCCGPYLMESWTLGEKWTFVKNPDYWDAASYANQPDHIEFRLVQNVQSALLDWQSGNIDVVKLSGELVEGYKDQEGFTSALQGYLWYLSENFGCKAIQNENFRKALSLAVDRDTIVNNVLKDGSAPAEGIIPVKFAYHNGVDYRDTQGSVVSYDVKKAQEFYAKAKEELGGDVTIELLFEDSESSTNVATYIQACLEENLPGLTVNLNSKPKKTRLSIMSDSRDGNDYYELALHRWGPDYADPQTYMDLFTSFSSNNYGQYKSDAYDAAIVEAEKGASAADSDARWQLMLDAEKILVEQDTAVVPVYQQGGAYMVQRVSGIEYHSAGVNNYRHMTVSE